MQSSRAVSLVWLTGIEVGFPVRSGVGFYLGDAFLEVGEFGLDNVPEDFIIYREIGMGKNVSESCNFSPLDLRINHSHGIWDIFYGFANDL